VKKAAATAVKGKSQPALKKASKDKESDGKHRKG